MGSTDGLPQNHLGSCENAHEPHPKSVGSECLWAAPRNVCRWGEGPGVETEESLQVGPRVSQTPQGILMLSEV